MAAMPTVASVTRTFTDPADTITLDDGRVIEARAAPEALYEIRSRDDTHFVQLALQLGNRHWPAQIFAEHILILARPQAPPEERIVGVETAGCPHTAFREDVSINLQAIARSDLLVINKTDLAPVSALNWMSCAATGPMCLPKCHAGPGWMIL